MNDINDTTLLVCGIALFLFAVGLIAHLVRKGKSFIGATALIPFAVVMIAFSHVKSGKIGGFEFNTQSAADFAKNPLDPSRRAAFDQQLSSVEKSQQANPTEKLTPEINEALQKVALQLASESTLSPEARVTLARTQLLLGQTTKAAANVHTVMATHPQLITADPNLSKLARITPATPAR